MAEHITGEYARRLLAYPDGAAPWIIEQRHLAETIVWLYGREPQQSHASGEVFHCAEEEDNDLPWAVSSMPGKVSVTPTDRRDLTRDEAVDLARALLNAAERMNDPT